MSVTAIPSGTPLGAQLFTPRLTRLGGALFFAAVAAALYWGWQHRDARYWVAEEGFGYALGIAGGVMMLLLLLYPLRKHARFMQRMGPVGWWFRLHMALGLLGPTAILFHANFRLGSLNSNVALACMLLVAGSGIVGRYFYTKIHYGLYGSRASLQELGDVAAYSKGRLAQVVGRAPQLEPALRGVEQAVLRPHGGLWRSLWHLLGFNLRRGFWQRRLDRILCSALRATADHEGWAGQRRRRMRREARRYLRLYLDCARKVAELAFYERLFALWHVVHLPFFLMLVISGVVHVVAVHMY